MLECSWQARVDSRSLLTCRIEDGKKSGREITKLAERFTFPFLPFFLWSVFFGIDLYLL